VTQRGRQTLIAIFELLSRAPMLPGAKVGFSPLVRKADPLPMEVGA